MTLARAAAEVDRALRVCLEGGFRRVLLRGDTDFSQTKHLDRWRPIHACVSFSVWMPRRPNIFWPMICPPRPGVRSNARRATR